MKVICRKCNNLIDEDEAIKLSVAEYVLWKHEVDCSIISFTSVGEADYHIYTQICQNCWECGKVSIRRRMAWEPWSISAMSSK